MMPTPWLLLLWALAGALPDAAEDRVSLLLTVDSGEVARSDTPVTVLMPRDVVPPPLREWLAAGPQTYPAIEQGGGAAKPGDPVPVQFENAPDEAVLLTMVLPGETPAATERAFRITAALATAWTGSGPWDLERGPRALRLRHEGKDVFRYNTAPVSHPDYPPAMDRDAYIGPAYTPGGALITGDFSKFHTHHRGFFLAYTHTKVGGAEPDFWNIQNGSGKIVHENVESIAEGAVAARFRVKHRWEARGKGPVLGEFWDVAIYDIPGRPYWLFDLTATQWALGEPMELVPYRYGGMAYRGPEPFVKGPVDVLTDGGAGRLQRDQKPARWVDLTGPLAEGAAEYGGAMILDHPRNPHHPTIARIHPTTLPFFCYVPGHDEPLTIAAGPPTVFRYRVAIHDGRPDAARNERLWRDFAAPPVAAVRVVND